MGRYCGDSGHCAGEWHHWFSSGGESGTSTRCAPETLVTDGQSHPRWRAALSPCKRTGARGPHRTRGGRQHSSGLAVADSIQRPHPGSCAHWRVGAGRQGRRRCVDRGCVAGRPSQHGVHGHGHRDGQSECDRGRDRDGHGVGPHRWHAPTFGSRADTAPKASVGTGQSAGHRLPGHRGRHFRDANGAWWGLVGSAVEFHQPRGRRSAGRIAHCGDADAGFGFTADGQAGSTGPQIAEC